MRNRREVEENVELNVRIVQVKERKKGKKRKRKAKHKNRRAKREIESNEKSNIHRITQRITVGTTNRMLQQRKKGTRRVKLFCVQ